MLAAAVAKHLADNVDGLTYDTGPDGNVFIAHMPSTPHTAVAVMPQPGLPQLSTRPTDRPGIQIRVRGVPHDVQGPYDMARAIYSELNCLDAVTLDEDGDDEVYVIGCTALQSDPTPLGRDDNERHEYTLNFSLSTKALTAHRS